ncbi:uncharacterized protein F4822DRAFT_428052 [Hypoxylon trugodes]|uniref:uncharacterized protein n=1 Tax=Hypoxylon trugodes TaxID=326681 RepID=UPI00219E5853|nr:uncharacterized protein F4822DRAFT_428052 [Hypoxylon trugodes]KAI1389709.1 hypothetical protein F4822DRAFT_428052 [Hypoxylon trugodes]
MVIQSRWKVPIPKCSVHKWLFDSISAFPGDEPLFIDAERPDTHFLTRSATFTPPLLMGILMAGGIFGGANPNFVARELAYQLKDTAAMFMVANDATIEIALEAAAEAGLPASRVYSFDDTAFDAEPGRARFGTKHWTTLLAPKN